MLDNHKNLIYVDTEIINNLQLFLHSNKDKKLDLWWYKDIWQMIILSIVKQL